MPLPSSEIRERGFVQYGPFVLPNLLLLAATILKFLHWIGLRKKKAIIVDMISRYVEVLSGSNKDELTNKVRLSSFKIDGLILTRDEGSNIKHWLQDAEKAASTKTRLGVCSESYYFVMSNTRIGDLQPCLEQPS